jgi:hypothetical protein
MYDERVVGGGAFYGRCKGNFGIETVTYYGQHKTAGAKLPDKTTGTTVLCHDSWHKTAGTKQESWHKTAGTLPAVAVPKVCFLARARSCPGPSTVMFASHRAVSDFLFLFPLCLRLRLTACSRWDARSTRIRRAGWARARRRRRRTSRARRGRSWSSCTSTSIRLRASRGVAGE